MKILRLSETSQKLQKKTIWIPNHIVIFIFLFFVGNLIGYAQLDQLANEVTNFVDTSGSIADDFIKIVKIIAFVALGITGLGFLYLRNNNQDLSEKIGKIVLGIAIFLILLQVGESLRS
ncbi:hypothetical protein [Tenacibaculum sp. MAR_2009_124]|uniref:hypothetical protein n=1 Tax=Tenacibaculum sp. MAR_2009_124 TaxID=1250059 RepID=UPI000B81AE29|nr:hypothetical protein [Tenacibaculum sp. MAR_2009_124]